MLPEKLSVLLIECDSQDAEHITGALSEREPFDEQDIEVEWTCSIPDSLKLLAERKFDAVMVDLSLPDDNGIDAICQVRSIFPEMPIVAVAGKDDQGLVPASISSGAQDFILKLSPGLECVRRSLRYAIERKKAENLMKELAVLQQRDTFVAMLAHDLRNPLIGCERILSLMLDGRVGEIPQEQIRLLSMIKNSQNGLLMMISNVLDCYRFEAGKETFEIVDVNLSNIIADCLVEMAPIARGKNIRMLHCFSADMIALADETAIRRVINNLLSNALKFTSAGGEIRVSFEKTDSKVSINIQDTGKGIAADELENLFQLFFQCQKTDRGAGLGIGLNICKHLIDAQNGSISCSSEPGKGSTFIVSLPAAGGIVPLGAASSAASSYSGSPIRGTIFEEVLQPFVAGSSS